MTLCVHFCTILCLLASLASTLAGLFGIAWWTREVDAVGETIKEERGILRQCETRNGVQICGYREKILKFDYLTSEEDIKPDIVLVLLLTSLFFCSIAAVNGVVLLCCRRSKTFWRCGTASVTILAMIGALSGFGGIIYAEVKSPEKFGYQDGWSNILGWLGSASQFIGSILAIIILCFPPKGQDGGHINVRPQTNYPVFVERTGYDPNSHFNAGYHMDDDPNTLSAQRKKFPEIRSTIQSGVNPKKGYELR